MSRKKIISGDYIRQKSTGNVFLVDFPKHDVWVCHDDQTGQHQFVSINDIEKVTPEKKSKPMP